MKRILGASFVLGVGFMLGFLFLAFSPGQRTGSAGGLASLSGDANGDGEIDLGDVLYLLNFLFVSGSPPVACGESASVHERLEALEGAVSTHEEILSHFSIVYLPSPDGSPSVKTIRIAGVNLQIVDGRTDGGWTALDGTGNLIIGRNELHGGGGHGSHNLVVGVGNRYEKAGGIVAGFENTISGWYATIMGGRRNTASGDFSHVSAGGWTEDESLGNTASGPFAAIFAGSHNEATGPYATITGGHENLSAGEWSHISGGRRNTAEEASIDSVIVGGLDNVQRHQWSVVTGGQGIASQDHFEVRP